MSSGKQDDAAAAGDGGTGSKFSFHGGGVNGDRRAATAADDTASSKGKKGHHHGGLGGIMCSLRKLTPPKMSLSRSSSSSNAANKSQDKGCSCAKVASDGKKSPKATGGGDHIQHQHRSKSEPSTRTNGLHDVGEGREAGEEAEAASSAVSAGPSFFCPALNCHQKLREDEVVDHAQDDHSLVVSDLPDSHCNSIEVGEADMAAGEESAAWAPTLLTAFDTNFFFETWRSASGKWNMWVYHLGTEEESEEFVAELEIYRGVVRLAYSGPVYSLKVPQTKITDSGKCLSFSDGLARDLLQPLEDGVVTGICYRVQVRRRDDVVGDGNDVTTRF